MQHGSRDHILHLVTGIRTGLRVNKRYQHPGPDTGRKQPTDWTAKTSEVLRVTVVFRESTTSFEEYNQIQLVYNKDTGLS